MLDTDSCLAAIRAKDPRFDGCFITAVSSTGIYCRPSCPARTPQARNVTFYPTAAAAQQAGFRACKRCRPDASPGSPEWDVRGDVVARAMRLIADGVVDREGVAGLAVRLGYSVRQLQRLIHHSLGAGPLAIARAQRAQTARLLIESSDLSLTDVAFAAGFASVRAFNETMQQVFAMPPSALRGGHGRPAATGSWVTIALRLPVRQPFCPDNVFGHLAATGVPGVEAWYEGGYHRTVRVGSRAAVVSLAPAAGHVAAVLRLQDTRDLAPVIARCRRLLDLDADPVAIDAHLAADPRIADLVAAHPGRRVPRTVDGAELALRMVLGQQVSTAAARTHASRIVQAVGEVVETPVPGLTHLFPTPEAVAGVDPELLRFPETRRRTLRTLAHALADGLDLGPGADVAEARAALLALNGIGPWTVESVAMRALGDPDAFPASDLGLLNTARRRGIATTAATLLWAAEQWRPWRSYATQYLWADWPHPVNHLPGDDPTTPCRGAA